MQIYRARKYISGHLGLGGGVSRKFRVIANGQLGSFRGQICSKLFAAIGNLCEYTKNYQILP